MAADLDPAAVLLAGMGMVAAPIVMPQVARELFGVDPSSEEFRDRYTEQLRRIVTHLCGEPPGEAGEAAAGPGRAGEAGGPPGRAGRAEAAGPGGGDPAQAS